MTAKLIVFGYELDATEGTVQGTLQSWKTDGDAVTKSLLAQTAEVTGSLWERVSA